MRTLKVGETLQPEQSGLSISFSRPLPRDPGNVVFHVDLSWRGIPDQVSLGGKFHLSLIDRSQQTELAQFANDGTLTLSRSPEDESDPPHFSADRVAIWFRRLAGNVTGSFTVEVQNKPDSPAELSILFNVSENDVQYAVSHPSNPSRDQN